MCHPADAVPVRDDPDQQLFAPRPHCPGTQQRDRLCGSIDVPLAILTYRRGHNVTQPRGVNRLVSSGGENRSDLRQTKIADGRDWQACKALGDRNFKDYGFLSREQPPGTQPIGPRRRRRSRKGAIRLKSLRLVVAKQSSSNRTVFFSLLFTVPTKTGRCGVVEQVRKAPSCAPLRAPSRAKEMGAAGG